MLEWPGLVDPHVHLREPGATHKEDFSTGTSAALAGGFSAVLVMPNTQPPITDAETLRTIKVAAKNKACCDFGIFLGAGEDNFDLARDLAPNVCGLKMYLDQTYGPLKLVGLEPIQAQVAAWPSHKPIAAHAEGVSLAVMLLMAGLYKKHIHICHVSRREEIILIRRAKERGFSVTCEVTPHHMFMTRLDVPGIGAGRGEVRPRLGAPLDRDALWDNLDVIDCFATDHAPHTLEEKDSPDPPPGFPGLETAVGLFLRAVAEGRLSQEQVLSRMYHNPLKIFNLPAQPETKVYIDPAAEWEISGPDMFSKCAWTPFEGMPLRGRVRRLRLRGDLVYEDGVILAPAGFGKDMFPTHSP